MIAADEAEEIRAATFAPADVAGVVDEARKIGVLEIDADGKNMPPALRINSDATGKIGPALRM